MAVSAAGAAVERAASAVRGVLRGGAERRLLAAREEAKDAFRRREEAVKAHDAIAHRIHLFENSFLHPSPDRWAFLLGVGSVEAPPEPVSAKATRAA